MELVSLTNYFNEPSFNAHFLLATIAFMHYVVKIKLYLHINYVMNKTGYKILQTQSVSFRDLLIATLVTPLFLIRKSWII